MELHRELEDPPPHTPEWTPAVICHPDRQRQREAEGGESAGLSDSRHASVSQSTRGKPSRLSSTRRPGPDGGPGRREG